MTLYRYTTLLHVAQYMYMVNYRYRAYPWHFTGAYIYDTLQVHDNTYDTLKVHDIPGAHYRYMTYLGHNTGTCHTYDTLKVHDIPGAHYRYMPYL